MKVHFYLDRHKGKLDKLPVFLHYWNRGELLRASTGEHCDSADWNNKKERVRQQAAGAKEINRILDSMEDEVLRLVRQEKALRRTCTIQDLRQNLTFLNGRRPGFFQVWDEFVYEHEIKTLWKKNTLDRFRVLKNHLLSINEKQTISFESISRKFLEEFAAYQAEKGLSPSYTRKNTEQLKWFLNWASIKGYNRNLDYKRFRFVKKDPGPSEKPDIHLTPEELIRILKLEPDREKIKIVRDAFCFACFTGLNYADLVKLEKKNVHLNKLFYTPQKSNRKLIVELIDVPRKIAEEYRHRYGHDFFPLPVIQLYNRMLKEIGKAAKIDEKFEYKGSGKVKKYEKWQLLSSRVSKNTFIKLGIDKGIGLEVMSELTGYAPGTLNKFYSVTRETMTREIRKLNSTTTVNINKL